MADQMRLDVLMYDAGVMPTGKLDNLAGDEWERVVAVNLKGVVWGIYPRL